MCITEGCQDMTQSPKTAERMALAEKLRSSGMSEADIEALLAQYFPKERSPLDELLGSIGTTAMKSAQAQAAAQPKIDITKLPQITPPAFQPQMVSMGGGGGVRQKTQSPYAQEGLTGALARIQAGKQNRFGMSRGIY